MYLVLLNRTCIREIVFMFIYGLMFVCAVERLSAGVSVPPGGDITSGPRAGDPGPASHLAEWPASHVAATLATGRPLGVRGDAPGDGRPVETTAADSGVVGESTGPAGPQGTGGGPRGTRHHLQPPGARAECR